MSKDYEDYLKSDRWREKRQHVLNRDNHTCQICGSKENLRVHHLTYQNIYKEPLTDLITVCDKCHSDIHSLQKKYEEIHWDCRKQEQEKLRKMILKDFKKRDKTYGGDLNFMEKNKGFKVYINALASFFPIGNISDVEKVKQQRDMISSLGIQTRYQKERNQYFKDLWTMFRDKKMLKERGAGGTILSRISSGEWD